MPINPEESDAMAEDRPGIEGEVERGASRADRIGGGVAIATFVMLVIVVWLRFGPSFQGKTIQVGERMPPTRLADLHEPGSRLLLGLDGRVLWLVFLSTESPSTPSMLPSLAAVWDRYQTDRRFGMAVAAYDPSGPDRVRSTLKAFQGKLPLYLAGREAPRRFGVQGDAEPWHFLIDPHGRIAAMARGSGEKTIERLSRLASDWLDALEPAADARDFLTLGGASLHR